MIIPDYYSFKHFNNIDIDSAIKIFDWDYQESSLTVDMSQCKTANYQAFSLLTLYLCYLSLKNVKIRFIDGINNKTGAPMMWTKMGCRRLFDVLYNDKENFVTNQYKPLFAIRNGNDFKLALEKVKLYTNNFNVTYEETLRYIISELLYNTIEHGIHFINKGMSSVQIPSIIQFSYYQKREELHFIVADLGIGIKNHLEKAYPAFETHCDAILYALKPKVSGTFTSLKPYQEINNAGMGLFLSCNIIKKLHADMHIVSGNGLVHISPSDITSKVLNCFWPGTFILVSIKLNRIIDFDFDTILSSFKQSALQEIKSNNDIEQKTTFYLNIFNFFGTFAENKDEAKNIRDKKILPAINENKKIIIDFNNVQQAPHSFLNALLATPINILGLQSYKRIKYTNETKAIRETLEYIFDENT